MFLLVLMLFVFFSTLYMFSSYSENPSTPREKGDFDAFTKTHVSHVIRDDEVDINEKVKKIHVETESELIKSKFNEMKRKMEEMKIQRSKDVSREPLNIQRAPTPQLEKPSEIINQNKTCKAIVGRISAIDIEGYVCSVTSMNSASCCSEPKKRYTCESCNMFSCCRVYENCVSCCMDPAIRDSVEAVFEKKKSEPLYKRVKSVFEFCSTRCRTSSKSVINENKYLSSDKHCYGKLDPHDIEKIKSLEKS